MKHKSKIRFQDLHFIFFRPKKLEAENFLENLTRNLLKKSKQAHTLAEPDVD